MYDNGQQFGLEFHADYLTFNLGNGFQVYSNYLTLAVIATVLVTVKVLRRRGLLRFNKK